MKKLFVLCCIGGILVSLEGAQKRELTHIFDKKFYVDQDPTKGLIRGGTMCKFPSKNYANMLTEFENIKKPIEDYISVGGCSSGWEAEVKRMAIRHGRRRPLEREGDWRALYLIYPFTVSKEEYDEDVQLKILKGELPPPPPRVRTIEEMAVIAAR